MSTIKYIFVTGGVVSGLGKGITAASIGLILKSNNLRVDAIKFDPYLNVDPGTMSPFEHGEVFVLNDGTECDLDLGHYERFLDIDLTSISSITAGKIYSNILEKERMGEFLGKNVQLIPNVTNYIKNCFVKSTDNIDVRIIEIGGSAGDMEGEIFLEAIRQFKQEQKTRVLHIHLGYVPFLSCSGEYKTKPFQSSLRELLRSGLGPDILVARYEKQKDQDLSSSQLEKLSLFGNVPPKNVIPMPDLESIYKVPAHFCKTDLLDILASFTNQKLTSSLPKFFQNVSINKSLTKIKIAVVGKYGSTLGDADYSVIQSLIIASFHAGASVESIIISAEDISNNNETAWEKLKSADGVLVLGGFGNRGMEGKIEAIKWARENKKPFLGICLGLQMAVIEFARNVCKTRVFSAEMFDENIDLSIKESNNFIINYIKGQKNISKKGGTMRLGAYQCDISPDSLANSLYQKTRVLERHRHRLELQTSFVPLLEANGMKVSGKHFYQDEDGNSQYLPEIIELEKSLHPFFIAIQSHPEMLSRPMSPHPLFLGLVEACKKLK